MTQAANLGGGDAAIVRDVLPLRVLQRDDVKAAVRRMAEAVIDAALAEAATLPADAPDPLDDKAIRKLAKTIDSLTTLELQSLDREVQRVVWEALQTVELPLDADGKLTAERDGEAQDGPDLQGEVPHGRHHTGGDDGSSNNENEVKR